MITEENDKKRILIACHNDPTSGHLGVKKTLKRVCERFAWKGINDEVAKLVWSICLKMKFVILFLTLC